MESSGTKSSKQEDSSLYFSIVTKVDRLKAYKFISHQAPPVSFKARGQNTKFLAKAISFNQNDNVLECVSEDFKNWKNLEKVSLSFQVTTIQFYSKGTVLKDSSPSLGKVKLDKELYMLERRDNFRLTIPYDIPAFLYIPIVRKNQLDGKTEFCNKGTDSVFIVDDTSEKTVNNIFKQFMDMNQQEAKKETKNYLQYDLKDLSAGGLSFTCPSNDAAFLAKGSSFKKVTIILNEESILIHKAQIIHIQKFKDPDSESLQLQSKIAIRFLELEEVNQDKLFQFINKEVSKQDLLLNFEEAIL